MYILMYIPESSACSVVCLYQPHRVVPVSWSGVAGFVVNSNNQVLAIQERYHVAHNLKIWKLPGGLADAGNSSCACICTLCSVLCKKPMHSAEKITNAGVAVVKLRVVYDLLISVRKPFYIWWWQNVTHSVRNYHGFMKCVYQIEMPAIKSPSLNVTIECCTL